MNFSIRQRRAGVLLLLICSIISLPTQENRDRELDETPIAAKTKPNIVLMLTDNLGYSELGVYGGGILRGAPTPRIEASGPISIQLERVCHDTLDFIQVLTPLVGFACSRSHTPAVMLLNASRGLSLSR
jgi:hypothetical protein